MSDGITEALTGPKTPNKNSDEDNRGNRVRRVLDNKRQPPAYQQLDLEPKEGGRSLLHDEFGIPKVSSKPEDNLPPLKELPNEPVKIKASIPDESKYKMAKGIPQKGMPVKSAEQMMERDDGFIPPKSNFVNVGQVDHAWHDEKVTGLPEQAMIDNNSLDSEDIDTDALQGLDPLADGQPQVSKIRQEYEERLNTILVKVAEQMKRVTNLEQLKQFKGNVLGKKGVLAAVLKEFAKLPKGERQALGQLVNQFVEALRLEFDALEYELISNKEDDEEDMGMYPAEEEETVPEPVQNSEGSLSLQEGDYAILVDNKLFKLVHHEPGNPPPEVDVRHILSRLVLGNDIDVERVQVIKRCRVDFGITLDMY